MGLQVRVRHALGERLIDLADRPIERPLIVGRSREADVKIPSVTVANEHLSLFVHNRQWVLQDTSGGATQVNGCLVEGPTPLCVGDVIILGSDASPARIEVDPAGVAQGRSGHPAETNESAPVAARAPTTAPPPAPPRPTPAPRAAMAPAAANYPSAPMPAAYAAPTAPAAPIAQEQEYWGAQPAAQDDPFSGWGAAPEPAAGGAAPTYRRRKSRSKSSDSAMIIGVAVCLLIVGGTAWILYDRMHPEPVVVHDKKQARIIVKDDSDNIFGIGHGNSGKRAPDELPPAPVPGVTQSPTPAGAPSPIVAPAPAPAPATDSHAKATSTPPPEASSPTPAPSHDKPAAPEPVVRKDEAAWKQVQDAFLVTDVGQAILKADDYTRQHPGESTKELDSLIDDSMDRLWWKRVTLLCTQQTAALDDIKKKDKEIKEESSPAFQKVLAGERKPLDDKLAEVQRHLAGEMSYTSTDPPPLDNPETMDKLRKERDNDKFSAWKQSTLRYIRRNHGSMPWDG